VANPLRVVQHEHGLETASPGATIFGPPLKPAKKCGSTTVDSHVRVHPDAIQENAHAGRRRADVHQRARSRLSWFTTR
jgi:hypothetical protein